MMDIHGRRSMRLLDALVPLANNKLTGSRPGGGRMDLAIRGVIGIEGGLALKGLFYPLTDSLDTVMVRASCVDADDDAVLFYNAWKVKIAFVLVAAVIDHDSETLAGDIDVVVQIGVIGAGKYKVRIHDIGALIGFRNPGYRCLLRIGSDPADGIGDFRRYHGDAADKVGQGKNPALRNGSAANDDNFFFG